MRTRWRNGVGPHYVRDYWSRVSNAWYPGHVNVNPVPPQAISLEYMQDSVHEVKLLGRTLNNIGGDLDHIKVEVSDVDWNPIRSYISAGNNGTHDVFIPFVSNAGGGEQVAAREALLALKDITTGINGSGLPQLYVETSLNNRISSHLSLSDMDVLGTNLVDAVRPTDPSVDVATTVAELLSEKQFFSPRLSGSVVDDYLNYSLGVAPTISFGKDFLKTARKADHILKQYERDAGRLVRRRYHMPEEIDTQSGTSSLWTRWSTPSNTDQGLYYSLSGGWKWTYKSSRKRWFSGAFTYPLPPSGWRRTFAEYERLYGIKPGVDTAWELVPFSFVADYFSNMGNVMSNINAFTSDGLVMPYGYVMETVKSTWTYQGTFGYKESPLGATKQKEQKLTINVEHRRRRAANPFGFGLDTELTARQGSILAALGISFLR